MCDRILTALCLSLVLAGCGDDDAVQGQDGSVCEDPCVDDARRCEGTVVETCATDTDGCLRWGAATDCADANELCDESSGEATCVPQGCTNTCPLSGGTRCEAGWVQLCAQSAQGCLSWQDDEDCDALGAVCEVSDGSAVCELPSTERVLFDDTIDWQWPTPQDYGGYGFYWWHRDGEAQYTISHYGEMPTDDWTSPVDYEHGTVWLRFQVVSQPTSRPFRVQLGIWQDYGLQPHHRECIGPGNNVAGGAGSQFEDTAGSTFADWWNHPEAPGPCDFTRPEDFYRIGIVLWDQANGCIPMGHDWSPSGCPELEAEFFPMTARVTAVAVASGESFSGWASYP